MVEAKVFPLTRQGKWPQRTSLSVFEKACFISASLDQSVSVLEETLIHVFSSGEVLGLLGPNGAGKSTIMHMLSGDTDPAAGQVQYR